jgi:putative NADH-flavin reductase
MVPVRGHSGGLTSEPGSLIPKCTRRRRQTIDWTFVSALICSGPGNRTGKYRRGDDQLLFDSRGESRISAEDFAGAFLDEVQNPNHVRRRFTVAY